MKINITWLIDEDAVLYLGQFNNAEDAWNTIKRFDIQDGLLQINQIKDSFVTDPSENSVKKSLANLFIDTL